VTSLLGTGKWISFFYSVSSTVSATNVPRIPVEGGTGSSPSFSSAPHPPRPPHRRRRRRLHLSCCSPTPDPAPPQRPEGYAVGPDRLPAKLSAEGQAWQHSDGSLKERPVVTAAQRLQLLSDSSSCCLACVLEQP
jgi:hypothetical protein